MKKTVYTVNVDNYEPQITVLTYPLMKAWAHRIGADFHIIDQRRSPQMPPAYEKLQIFDLARERGDDWSIFLDSDALVHPETFDFTNFLSRDTVAHNGNDMAAVRWTYDEYFLRDGRNIGSCNWCAIASSWCRDLWHPLTDLTLEHACARIHPIVAEQQGGVDAVHLLDDYVLSRNIARFGLKFKSLCMLLPEIGLPNADLLWHIYNTSADVKIVRMRETLQRWKLL